MPSKAADRGIQRSASATASGCSCRAIRWRITVRTTSRHRSLTSERPIAARKPSGPPSSRPSARRSQYATLALGRPRWAGVTIVRWRTRSGCARATATAVAEPMDCPASAARSMPRWSRTATASRARTS